MGRLNLASSTATTLQTKTSRAALLVNQLGVGAAVKGVATSGRAVMGEAGSNGTGVWAFSPNHYGVHARSDRGAALNGESFQDGVGVRAFSFDGNAGEFFGPIFVNGYQDMNETATPAAPSAFRARIFVRNNGVGKHELCVRFPTGAVQVIATEP